MDDLVSIGLKFVGLRRHKIITMMMLTMIMTSMTVNKVAVAIEEQHSSRQRLYMNINV
jgi:hypothetical protein